MTTLSIVLPDNLAKASQIAASHMGVSRTQFIRNAIARELEHYEMEQELEAMGQALSAMKASGSYMKEAENLMNGFGNELPEEDAQWWTKK